jgi:hypothetical protein
LVCRIKVGARRDDELGHAERTYLHPREHEKVELEGELAVVESACPEAAWRGTLGARAIAPR